MTWLKYLELIEVNNLSYKDILHEVSLSISENLVILGENGAGKSTLAKFMCGLIPSNKIFLDKKELTSYKNRAQLINYIPATLSIYDENITVQEYLQSAFYTSEIDFEAIKNMMQTFALHQQTLHTLSSGQKQLLQIALARLQNAKITIFDEPTANLDPQNSKKIFNILTNHFQQKIIITHDLNLAYKLGYKVLYLYEGHVAFFGSFKEFLAKDFYNGSVLLTPHGIVIDL